MRLVSLAALLLGAVPLVAAEEAEVAGGRRSCIFDEVLRTLRLDQEQSIPFCRKFLTTIIIVSVTVTISDTTITTQTIRPTYTNVLVKTETSTVDDQGLIKRILAERDESDDYSNSLIAQYPSSALSSACSCLCVDPAALVTLVSTQITSTQTIPETTIIDTATEFETVTGPSTTTDTTTTTTTTVVVAPTGFPTEEFWLRFYMFWDEFGYPTRFALSHQINQDVMGVEDPSYHSFGGDQFQFKDDGHLPSFDVMQLCQFPDAGFLGTWAVGAALGSDISCTEIPLAIEPRVSVETTFSFNIFYQDSGGVKQYLTLETIPPPDGEQQELFLTTTPNKDGLIPFSISYGHLTFTPDDFVWFYTYFFPSGLFQQEGGGATLITFNSPSFVKFNFPGDSTYFEWEIDWEAYTIYPVIPEPGPFIMQICTNPDFHPTGVWAIGQILYNEEGYTGHLKFSSNPDWHAPGDLYAWSPHYPDPAGEEWGGVINFSLAADIPDPSYYFRFYQNIDVTGSDLVLLSPQAQNIQFKACLEVEVTEEGDFGYYPWYAATPEYDHAQCTVLNSANFRIRPKSWPFRLSYVDSEGQKQYLRYLGLMESDNFQNTLLRPTSHVAESALFTIDAYKTLWYALNWTDGPVRLFSRAHSYPYDDFDPVNTNPFHVFFNAQGVSSDPLLEWEIETMFLLRWWHLTGTSPRYVLSLLLKMMYTMSFL
ncbi:hypothetical protein V8F33_000048 [Rhypophila sp. PSN 637]